MRGNQQETCRRGCLSKTTWRIIAYKKAFFMQMVAFARVNNKVWWLCLLRRNCLDGMILDPWRHYIEDLKFPQPSEIRTSSEARTRCSSDMLEYFASGFGFQMRGNQQVTCRGGCLSKTVDILQGTLRRAERKLQLSQVRHLGITRLDRGQSLLFREPVSSYRVALVVGTPRQRLTILAWYV
ncbi:unnamed protein product [Cochlearia groenlandica]